MVTTRRGKKTGCPVDRSRKVGSSLQSAVLPPISPQVSPIAQRRRIDQSPSSPARTEVVAPSPSVSAMESEAPSSPAMTEAVAPSSGVHEMESDDLEPIHPEKLFLHSSNYTVTCKLSSASDNVKTIEYLKDNLSDKDYEWFTTHPQFKHLFHMPREKNHMLTHMWMLLVRTVKKEKGKMAWFIVNGVPVRYSIREHGLITGLSCKAYPQGYEETFGGESYGRDCWGILEEDGKKKEDLRPRC